MIETVNNKGIVESLLKEIANTSVQGRTKQKKKFRNAIKVLLYCLKVGGNEDIFSISWVVLGVNFSSRRKHNKH